MQYPMINALLPTEILVDVFSYLEQEDLKKAALVSKEWNELQKTDELWKRHCLKFMKNAEPLRGSWKERFKVINNWMHTRAERTFLASSHREKNPFWGFRLLEDNTPIEMYRSEDTEFTVRNVINDELHYIRVDLKDVRDGKIVSATMTNKTWMGLASNGNVFFYDIRTGQYLNQMSLGLKDDQTLNWGMIKSNKNDIFVATNEREIKVFNGSTGHLEQTIDVSGHGDLHDFVFTTNFIICKCRSSNHYKAICIRKRDHKIEEVDLLDNEAEGIAAFDSHFAIFTKKGNVKFFKDEGDSFHLIKDVPAFFPHSDSCSRYNAYKNWFLISRSEKLKIYDIKTGQELSTFPLDERFVSIHTNGIQLLTHRKNTRSFSLYNFERPVTQLNSPSEWVRCNIQ
jgi:hypothetical protein